MQIKSSSAQPLQLVVIPGRGVNESGRHFYNELYSMWKTVWKDTLLELDGSDTLFSDHFTRQDYHLALFHANSCATAISFRRIDFGLESNRDDSWLKIWPTDYLRLLSDSRKQGMMVSWFFVDPRYRRAGGSSELADLEVSVKLTEMISYFLLDANIDIAFAGVRNNRSVNSLFVRSGTKVLKSNMMNHGVAVDLVTWEPKDLVSAVNSFSHLAQDLWSRRIVFQDQPLVLSNPKESSIHQAA